jgi:UDP-N-acetyl-D-mannosaminuronic acid dehydrogenase
MPQPGFRAEEAIAVAYCPERVLPGQMVRELQENDRVIGGISPLCAPKASVFYRAFLTKGQCYETTAATAELVKLAENAFRDVNIAFANELSMIAEVNDINPWELIALANRHPRVNILQPGPGVGGHCIAVDPWFIVAKNPNEARIIRVAREVNLHKTEYVLQRIIEAIDRRHAKCIAMLGLAYKPNVDDLRESPGVELTLSLVGRRQVEVLAVEPHIVELPQRLRQPHIRLATLEEALRDADLFVTLVKHDAFRQLNYQLPKKPILDICGLLV